MKTLLILILTVLFVGVLNAQFSHTSITIPETAQSDSFKTPQGYYLTGLNFNNPLDSDMDTVFFYVTNDPGLGFSTLYIEGEQYIEVIPDSSVLPGKKAVSLKIPKTVTWEWWKIGFTEAINDSTTFEAVYGQ